MRRIKWIGIAMKRMMLRRGRSLFDEEESCMGKK
jgi:hypothetical protein